MLNSFFLSNIKSQLEATHRNYFQSKLKRIRNAISKGISIYFQIRTNPFEDFINEYIDSEAYLEAYPDVRAAGIDPAKHWLKFGWLEGRTLFPTATVVIDKENIRKLTGPGWRYFSWNGNDIAFRPEIPVKESLITQIITQGRHEPAVLASGALALRNLKQFDSIDLLARDGVNVQDVFAGISERPKTVILIPFLCVGGAEKYAADLVDSLNSLGHGPILVLVTEFQKCDANGWESINILKPFLHTNLCFWKDLCGSGYANPIILARLLNAIRPSQVVVINSRLGLEVVARFGRGLSQITNLYCAYFSLGVMGLGVPYGTRYPYRTLPFSKALTDNTLMKNDLHRLWGGLPGRSIEILPPGVQLAADGIFLERLKARILRARRRARSLHWVWISRIEIFKGTEILTEILKLRPKDQFDIFGPIHGKLADYGLGLPNLRYCGMLSDVSSSDFTKYDGFLFTSKFEGMPNIVLEMSQHAIPMVLADVGGLRSTFDENSVQFVKHSETSQESAKAFSKSMDYIENLSANKLKVMLETANSKVQETHSPAAHLKNVSKLFTNGVNDV